MNCLGDGTSIPSRSCQYLLGLGTLTQASEEDRILQNLYAAALSALQRMAPVQAGKTAVIPVCGDPQAARFDRQRGKVSIWNQVALCPGWSLTLAGKIIIAFTIFSAIVIIEQARCSTAFHPRGKSRSPSRLHPRCRAAPSPPP